MRTLIVLTLLGVMAGCQGLEEKRQADDFQVNITGKHKVINVTRHSTGPFQSSDSPTQQGPALALLSTELHKGDDPPGHEAGRLLHSEEVMMSRSSANAVIKRQRRSSDYYERFFQRAKSPLEVKMERCENYRPCDQLSEWVGFYQAYRRYFGPV